MKNKSYDLLKKIAQIWLPALGTLYFSMAGLWHLPDAQQVVGSVVIVDTFLGAVLHLSSAGYKNSDDKYDGEFSVDTASNGAQALRLKSIDYQALNTKDELLFKISTGVSAPQDVVAQ
jgi:hypothetical protein